MPKDFLLKVSSEIKTISILVALQTLKFFISKQIKMEKTEILTIHLVPRPRMKNLTIDFNFKDIPIKNRSTVGYLVTRKLIRHISIKQEGIQTLKGISYYFDEETLRINKEGKGIDLGEFLDDDYLIIIYKMVIIAYLNLMRAYSSILII